MKHSSVMEELRNEVAKAERRILYLTQFPEDECEDEVLYLQGRRDVCSWLLVQFGDKADIYWTQARAARRAIDSSPAWLRDTAIPPTSATGESEASPPDSGFLPGGGATREETP